MEQELQLWDDTRSQVIQFYLAKLFRRGNQNKTKLLYHFRIGQIDPETNSLKSVLEVLNRESHLEDWDVFSRKIRDIIIARNESAVLAPKDMDVELSLDRILATPQIETKLTIDGVAYMAQTPEITGHMGIDVKFWTTVDLLKKFQHQLFQILQNREFRSNIEILPEIEVNGLYADYEDEEKADEEEKQDEKPEDDVIKKAKPNTEMMMKVEDSIDSDDDKSVEVEDWEEEDLDELGGDDDIVREKTAEDETRTEESKSKIEVKKEVIEDIDKKTLVKSESVEVAVQEDTQDEKVEEEKTSAKPKGRVAKSKKTDKSSDTQDKDVKEEKPKKRTRAKAPAKKTPAKKTPAKKSTAGKRTKAKKTDEDKPEEKNESKVEKKD